MNKLILSGRVQNIKILPKITYITLMVYNPYGNTDAKYEFYSMSIFGGSKDWADKRISKGDYVEVDGHIHIDNHNTPPKIEIIGDTIGYSGASNPQQATRADNNNNNL